MSDKPLMFMTGLPRSRTSWWSVLLSQNGFPCHHDLLSKVESLADFDERMQVCAGDCDSGLIWLWPLLKKQYPNARWLIILRDVEECIASFQHAARGSSWQPIGEQWGNTKEQWLPKYDALVREMSKDENTMFLEFDMLDSYQHVSCAFEFLTRNKMSRFSWDLLNELNIEPVPSKVPFLPKQSFVNEVQQLLTQGEQ